MLNEQIKKLAMRAYAGISFSPEKRGESIIADYSKELEADLSALPMEERERYSESYQSKLGAWLSSQSSVMSTMITGPSNFPTERNRKRSGWADNKYNEFRQWREKTLSSIQKKALAARPEHEKINDEWKGIEKKIRSAAQMISAIDQNLPEGRGYDRPLFVNVIANLVNRLGKNAQVDLVNRSLDLIESLNKENSKPVITPKNKIWKLREEVEIHREKLVDKASQENEESTINGVQVVKNFEADRIQLFFDGKPEAAIIQLLKKSGWKWSPTNGCWQRKITNAATYSANEILKNLEP